MTLTAAPTATDAAVVATALFRHLEHTWNRSDATTYSQAFASDADFVDIRGVHHVGRPAIAAGHQQIFDTIYAGSTVAYRVLQAREIAGGVILAHVRGTIAAPSRASSFRPSPSGAPLVQRAPSSRVPAVAAATHAVPVPAR